MFCLLCMSKGSGPPHLICFLISVIKLHIERDRNSEIFLKILLLGQWKNPHLLVLEEVKRSIQLGLDRKIYIQLKLKF